MELIAEVTRQPVEIEPPDGVCKKFRNSIGPGLAETEQLDPRHGWARLLRGLLVDISKFRGGERRVFCWLVIFEVPQHDPRCREEAGDQKSGMPPKAICRYRHQHGGQNHTDICAA